MGQCRFNGDCAYKHLESTNKMEQDELVEKVKQLEKVTQALTRNVLSLEEEITDLKSNKASGEVVEGKGLSNRVKERKSEDKKDNLKNNCFKFGNMSEPQNKNSTEVPVEKKDIFKKSEKKVGLFTCSKCEYITKEKQLYKNP